ncbi:hypothetical protein KIN20_000151 [Parelaphostrongylus tenuis]|uniref:Uncharacterized protein n=1 Tax=Parelaphostrongylus tenuis TaxID=148309 RepID=A0AAD5MK82_PARTN|nr:hypothetical protein KIN20_000151 [Parelaphostrongylus tenuis]
MDGVLTRSLCQHSSFLFISGFLDKSKGFEGLLCRRFVVVLQDFNYNSEVVNIISFGPMCNIRVLVLILNFPLDGPKGTCFTSGDTVTSICIMPGGNNMCNVMERSTVPVQHRTISGIVSTTNIIMANWSIQMWQDVMNRVARSLASGPFGLQFSGVSVTVGS